MTAIDPHVFRLCLVTDAAACRERELADVVRAAVRGGVSSVQLREKTLSTRAFVARACLLREVLAEAPQRVPLLINDRLDVALASGADGVHVGQSDLPADVVRRYLPDGIVGLSVESIADVEAAVAAGVPVDYFGVSPVFATPTKTDTAEPLGLAGLAAIRALTTLPLVAIGGIGIGNAASVFAAGADGIAVVSAICSADSPELAARALATVLTPNAAAR